MAELDIRGWVRCLMLALLSGLGAGLLVAAMSLLLTEGAKASPPSEMHSGAMHVRTAAGQVIRHVPRLKTDASIRVSGMLARVSVKQRFLNPSPEWVEGVYVFPLPGDAAVDHLRMVVGERVIEGEIQPRQQARRTYQQAKAAGQRASLVEQHRPNIFSTSLANIPPGEQILVEIEYQQTVAPRDGLFSLRFPTVVGPRYIPGEPIEERIAGFDAHGWGKATDQVPDAVRITPPVLDAGETRVNAVSLKVELDTGVPAEQVSSLFHPVNIQDTGRNSKIVTLADGEMPADRDFVLEWRLAGGASPDGALFQEQHGSHHYALLMLTPPSTGVLSEASPLPRELILVVDTSGSMHGASIAQARAALKVALGRLSPGDRFNIIRFSDSLESLFERAMTASKDNLRKALGYVDRLQADGGTEMEPAMRLALSGDPGSALRQVVFLTDGDIGNEQALFDTIRMSLGDSRLFPVAIGSAPNSWFLKKSAAFGRGSATFIGDLEEVEEKMVDLFKRLSAPVLTDVRVDWEGAEQPQQVPGRVPDLYAGEPLLLTVRSDRPLRGVRVEGRLGDREWHREITLDGGARGGGVAVLWARRMIAEAMALRNLDGDPDRIRETVLALALEHHLVSPHTSLVAVDKTPARPSDEALHSKPLPTHLPHGWSQAQVFGGMPQTASPARLYLLAGLLLLSLSGLAWRRRWL